MFTIKNSDFYYDNVCIFKLLTQHSTFISFHHMLVKNSNAFSFFVSS